MAISVAQALKVDVLRQCRILAGAQHLDRAVEHINVLEVFVEGDEQLSLRNHLLLTTFAFTGSDSARQAAMIELVASSGCSAILFQEGVVAPLAQGVIDVAERQGLPLIEVSGSVLYHQIIEPLAAAMLHDESYRLQHALAVHRRMADAALGARGLDELLNTVAALLCRPVAVVGGLEGWVGRSDGWTAPDMPALADLVDTRTARRLGDCWTVPLRDSDWLLVSAPRDAEALSPLDRITLEEVVGSLSLDVYHRRSIDQSGRRQREALLEALLAISLIDELATLLPQMARAAWRIGRPTRAIRLRFDFLATAADVSSATPDDRALLERDRALRLAVDLFAAADPGGPVALFRGAAAYLPSDLEPGPQGVARLRERAATVLGAVSVAAPAWQWRIGAGGVADDATQLADSFNQAERALALSDSLPELGPYIDFDQVALPALLLELRERRDVRQWQLRTLGALAGAEAERADLLRTLDVFLDTGDSHKQAARLLDIHPKTLKYRLDRISELLSREALRPDQRLSMHLAVKLARLTSPRR